MFLHLKITNEVQKLYALAILQQKFCIFVENTGHAKRKTT